MYDKATSAEIINSLGGFSGLNPMAELENLDGDLLNNFYNELNERLLSQEYDSETVVKESLENASKDFFRGMNYQIKRGIENDFNLYGKDYTLEKYFERADYYKSADYEDIQNYVDYIETLDNIEFYF